MANREVDFIDLMAQALAMGTPVDWLIRPVHNSKVRGRQGKLWEWFDSQHCLAEIRFTLPAQRGQAAREAV